MNNTFAAKTLLFDQPQFFRKEEFVSGLKLPLTLTTIYACVAAVFQSGGDIMSAISIMAMIFIGWILVTAVFYLFVHKLGHAECDPKNILAVTGYGSVPLLIGTVLSLLIGFFGGMSALMTALFNIGVLLWCIPIWVYGISLVADVSPKQALTLIAVPIIAMMAMDIWGTLDSTGQSVSTGSDPSGGNGMMMSGGGGGGPPSGGGGGGGGGGVRIQM